MQSQFDDIGIMERVAAHDQQALLALYQEYGRVVYSLAYRILQNSTLAEEVTQDTFLKVWQRTQWDPNKGKLKKAEKLAAGNHPLHGGRPAEAGKATTGGRSIVD
jgi:hypothetical protein